MNVIVLIESAYVVIYDWITFCYRVLDVCWNYLVFFLEDLDSIMHLNVLVVVRNHVVKLLDLQKILNNYEAIEVYPTPSRGESLY